MLFWLIIAIDVLMWIEVARMEWRIYRRRRG